MKNSFEEILWAITSLTQNYANTYRGNVNYQKYKWFQDLVWENKISFDMEWVRESLICHVGHLPIVASYLHQFLEHKDEVNLGRSLMMLSIHDIWETVVWDVITTARSRTVKEEKDEQEAVKALLSDDQYKLYLEYEHATTLDGKFAKSVDKIGADIMAYANDPVIEKARLDHFWFTIDSVYEKKKQYMERDFFLLWFFAYLIEQTQLNLKL